MLLLCLCFPPCSWGSVTVRLLFQVVSCLFLFQLFAISSQQCTKDDVCWHMRSPWIIWKKKKRVNWRIVLGYRVLYYKGGEERCTWCRNCGYAWQVRIPMSPWVATLYRKFSWKTDPLPVYPAPCSKNLQSKTLTATYSKILMITW